jgi:hypothetical protein
MRGHGHRIGYFVIGFAVLLAACSKTGSSTSPTSPASAVTSGATIAGSVLGGGSSSTTQSSTGGGITVTVVGTNVMAPLDSGGHFTLTGVPGGDVQLHFSGSTTNATLTVSSVQSTDNFTITVTLNGTSATLNSDSRHDNNGQGNNGNNGNGNPNEPQQQIEGLITAIPPTTPALSFMVAGQTVRTNASTIFDQDDTPKKFTDLKVGLRVHVKGNTTAAGFLATEVELQVPDQPEPTEAEISGKIVSRTGTAPLLTLVIGTTTIHTNASTTFGKAGDATSADEKGGDQTPLTFASLVVGFAIDVEGIRQADGSILATKISREDD